MLLYLIRHGQSHVNLESWSNGNTDEGLTKLGQEQAAALARWLPPQVPRVDALYCSTMRRAKETAAYLSGAYETSPLYDDRLREIGNNRLDHSPWPNDNLPEEYADYWSSERPFAPVTPVVDGGETMMHFRTRVGLFLEELIQNHLQEVVVAVCHGGVIEVTFDHAFNIGAFRHCEIHTANTGITSFEYVGHPRRESWRLHYHNRTEHLVGLEEKKEQKAGQELRRQ